MPSRQPTLDLLIAGASARAAAFSAFRGGLSVATADQFADRDLSLVAQATEIPDWPDGVLKWANSFPRHLPLMYLGGLENEPELVEMIGRQRTVFGVVGNILQGVRCPEVLGRLLAKQGIAFAESVSGTGGDTAKNSGETFAPTAQKDVTERSRWLVKRRKSGGGRGIQWWDGEPISADEHLQRFCEGVPCSVAYLAHDNGCEVLGHARALAPSENCRDCFRYQGSVTVDFDAENEKQFRSIGDCLANVGVRGLFGVDLIRSGGTEKEITVLEVNPRYTASMEVHELRIGMSFVKEHLGGFDSRYSSRQKAVKRLEHYGKRIVYAPRDVRIGEIPLPSISRVRAGIYSIADIPMAGSVLPGDAPICTVIAKAKSSESCEAALQELEAEVLAGCKAV